MKYKCIKELKSNIQCLEKHKTIKIGDICTLILDKESIFNTFVICYNNKKICDADSKMAKEYFKEIKEDNNGEEIC